MGKLRVLAFLLFTAVPLSFETVSAGQPLLHPADVDVGALLAAPPRPGSAEQTQDLGEVRAWQAKRSHPECERAGRVAHVTLGSGFGLPDGPLSQEEVKRWEPLFASIKEEAEAFITSGKKRWHRPRPFVTDSSLHPCVEREAGKKPSFSYPSGHATLGRLFARVLGELDPARQSAFLARGDEIAADRVRAGVHYPKDIEAGKKLGDALFEALRGNPEFRSRIGQARLKALPEAQSHS